MARIKITDTRQGNSFRFGINGRIFDYPIGSEQEVEDIVVQNLTDLGVAFEEVSSKGAGKSSKEGSVEGGPVPTGPHDVISAGTQVKSLNMPGRLGPAGDQPGDLTSQGAELRFNATGGTGNEKLIEQDAKVSDIRVAAERQSKHDAPVAEKAGEGEGGTRKAVVPKGGGHVETKEEKAAKAEAAKAEKAAKASEKK